MATAEVGSLRVSLAMSTAEFDKAAKAAQATVSTMVKNFSAQAAQMSGGWKGVAVAAAAAAAAIGVAFGRALGSADELNKLSQKTGIAVDDLSALKYAGDLADVSLEQLAKGVKTLAVNMEEIASGNKTSDAARAFAAMGISATDSAGRLKGADQIIAEVADKFATYTDGVGKAALANAIFGKSGSDLIPLLNGGRQGLEDAKNEAEAFGLVISANTAASAEHLRDNMTKLGSVMSGFATKLVGEISPVLVTLTDDIVDCFKEWKIGETVVNALSSAFTAWVTEGLIVKATFAAIAQQVANLSGMIGNLFTGNWTEGIKQYEAAQDKLAADTAARIQEIRAVWNGWSTTIEATGATVRRVHPPIVASTQSIADAQKDWNKSVQDGVNLVKQLEPPYEKLARQLDNLGDAYAAGKINAQQLADAQKQLSETARIAFAGGADLIKATTTPYEQLQVTLKNLQDQYDRAAISADALGKAQQQATLVAVNSYASMASNIAGNLGQLFQKSKTVSIAVALINTFEAVTKALAAYPPPFSYVAAAAALAAGLAQVSKIKSTSSSGGGSAGGGGGGGGAVAAAGPTQAPGTLTVEGIRGDHFYSGNQVAGIARALVDYQKNGGQVVVQKQ